jgi:hypothetical protein
MNKLAIVVGLCVIGVSSTASAESWKAGLKLIPEKSGPQCAMADVSNVVWDLNLEGSTLTGVSNLGPKFSTPVGPDGSVKASYTGTLGAATYPVDLVGNVKTKQIEVVNPSIKCTFKLVPM